MTEEQKVEIPEILLDRAFLYRVRTEFLDHDIVGEAQTKTLLFVICASSYTPFPLGAIITGSSSAGKSWMAKQTLKYFVNTEYYSRLTAHSLDRSEFDFANKILYIGELYGAQEEAQSKIRVVISEGKLRLLTTAVEGGGTEVLETYGIPVFITTATQVNTDEELLNRLFIISIDETLEQTKRILNFEARKFETFETLDEVDVHEKGERLRAIWEPIHQTGVIDYKIPFATALSNIFPKIKNFHVKARRDFKKLLWIIGTIAVLHQYQRPIILRRTKDGTHAKMTRWVLALPVDFYMAWRVCGRSLQETLLNLQRRELQALDCFEEGLEYSTADIAPQIGKSDSRTREFLNDLWKKGFLSRRDHDEKGKLMRPYKYKRVRRDTEMSSSVFNFESIFRDWNEEKLKEFLTAQECDAVPSKSEAKIFTDQVIDPITGRLMNHESILRELEEAVEHEHSNTASHKTLDISILAGKPETMKLGDSILETETEESIKQKTMQETIEYMKEHLTKPVFSFEDVTKACRKAGGTNLYCASLIATLEHDGLLLKLPEGVYQWVR